MRAHTHLAKPVLKSRSSEGAPVVRMFGPLEQRRSSGGEPQADATQLHHTTLATSRLRFLFVAAKIWRHAGRTGASYSDHYEEKGMFERLMDRLRRIAPRGPSFAPVMVPALR